MTTTLKRSDLINTFELTLTGSEVALCAAAGANDIPCGCIEIIADHYDTPPTAVTGIETDAKNGVYIPIGVGNSFSITGHQIIPSDIRAIGTNGRKITINLWR